MVSQLFWATPNQKLDCVGFNDTACPVTHAPTFRLFLSPSAVASCFVNFFSLRVFDRHRGDRRASSLDNRASIPQSIYHRHHSVHDQKAAAKLHVHYQCGIYSSFGLLYSCISKQSKGDCIIDVVLLRSHQFAEARDRSRTLRHNVQLPTQPPIQVERNMSHPCGRVLLVDASEMDVVSTSSISPTREVFGVVKDVSLNSGPGAVDPSASGVCVEWLEPKQHATDAVSGVAYTNHGNALEKNAARGGFANETQTTCYLGALLQALFSCDEFAELVRDHKRSHACGTTCQWCFLARSEKETRSAGCNASLKSWKPFFSGLPAEGNGLGWSFGVRQHDVSETLTQILTWQSVAGDPEFDRTCQCARSLFELNVCMQLFTEYSCDCGPGLLAHGDSVEGELFWTVRLATPDFSS